VLGAGARALKARALELDPAQYGDHLLRAGLATVAGKSERAITATRTKEVPMIQTLVTLEPAHDPLTGDPTEEAVRGMVEIIVQDAWPHARRDFVLRRFKM